MSRIRVALVAPSLGILGGQAVQADRLIRAWAGDDEVEAWLVPINPAPPRLFAAATRVKYLRTLATEFTYLPLLVRELARADVAHIFSASYASFLLAPLPAIAVARALGKPVLLNYRSGEAPDHLSRSAIARRAVAGADLNVVPSSFLVDVFGQFGIRATIIPNLIDLESFRLRDRATLKPRLVSTRNFDPLYNVACTLRAFRIVQDRWPEATLTLVGGGPEERMLRGLAETLRLRNVEFAGRVPPDQIARHYGAADIYVQTPDIDNTPTSVLEAFASGLPVVSTGAGGVPAILRHEEHGLLAPVGDHQAVAAHVLRLLDEPDAGRRFAVAAYATCGRCTWAALRDEWLRAYRSVLPADARAVRAARATTGPTLAGVTPREAARMGPREH